ncbi:unnamed protein product [Ascophyllum nodosum]
MLQMMKQMQEHRHAADERQRQFMAATLEADQTPAAIRPTIEKSPTIKIDFKEFSGEPEDWTTWSEVHRAQGSVDPDRLHKAQQAWVSLVTSCKGAAFDIMNAEESASEAWAKLVQHYRAGGLKERRRLTIDVYMMKMELGVHPRKFLLRVDQMVKELERVDRLVDPKGIDTFILISGLTPQYDAEVRVLESSSDWLTREWIERAVMKQYERLEFENLPPGAERSCPPAATAGTINPPSDAPFAPAQITLLCNAVNSRLPAVRRNRTDIRGMENMVATAEAPGTAEVAEMAEAAKAAEWAATVDVEAVRVAAGAAVSQRKVSWISDPAIRPLAPTATSV